MDKTSFNDKFFDWDYLHLTAVTHEKLTLQMQKENIFYQNILEASNLEPQPFGVPWVTFDGVWIDIEEDYNMDFKQVLCTFFINDVPECSNL